MTQPMINPQRVTELLRDCLFASEEIINGKPVVDPIFVEGIRVNLGFHPERLTHHKPEINAMLDLLPENFKEGWSFLHLCTDKNGQQWTGLQKVSEELMCLGIGIGRLEYTAPKSMWPALPGGVPYLTLKPKVPHLTLIPNADNEQTVHKKGPSRE